MVKSLKKYCLYFLLLSCIDQTYVHAMGQAENKEAADQETIRQQIQKSIYDDNIPELEKLLSHLNNINSLTEGEGGGYSMLHYAAEKFKIPAVKILLKHNADPNVLGRYGQTPLMYMCRSKPFGTDKTAKMIALMVVGLDPNGPNSEGTNPLMCAVKNNDINLVKELLEMGADITRQDTDRQTAIDFAQNKPDILAIIKEYYDIKEKEDKENEARRKITDDEMYRITKTGTTDVASIIGEYL